MGLGAAEVWQWTMDGPDARTGTQLVWAVALTAALIFTGFNPRVGGSVYVAIALASAATDSRVSVIVIGLYVVATLWIGNGWFYQAACAAIAVEGVSAVRLGYADPFIIQTTIGMTVAITAGLAIRSHRQKLEVANAAATKERERALRLAHQARCQLAQEVHDCAIRDLLRASYACRDLRENPSREAAEQAEAYVLGALASVRGVLSPVGSGPSGTSFTKAVEEASKTLQLRSTPLAVDDSVMSCAFGGQTERIAARFVTEGTTNALKYGAPGQEVQLAADAAEDGRVRLTLTNTVAVAATRDPASFSAGTGLAHLESAAREVGGVTVAWEHKGVWALALELPGTLIEVDDAGQADAASRPHALTNSGA